MKGERELNKIYGDANRELRFMLLDIDPASFNDRLAMKIEDKARRIVAALNLEMNEWVETYLKEAYRIGAGRARTALEILGRKPNRLFLKTERIFIDDTVELLIQRNNTIRKSVRDFLNIAALAARDVRSMQIQEWSYAEAAADLDELMNEALIKQKSRGWLAKQILDYLRTMVSDGELIDINGKMWRMNKYSKMVARTTLRTAQSKATEDLCQQYDNDLVEISDHGTDCEICQPYEGRVFSINGRTPGYEILDEWPPWHPNCLSDRNSRILTDKGLIPIGKIKKGDMVFTHRGRFKPVIHTMKREFNGPLIWINGLGITYNHRMFTESGLVPAGNLTRHDKLFELSSKDGESSGISLNPNYFPSQRRKFHIPFSVFLNSFVMSPSIDFKSNFPYSKINNINVNNLFLNKIYPIFGKYFGYVFGHFRLILQKMFSSAFCHSFADFMIKRRVVVDHPDFIFPVGFRVGVGNSTLFKSSYWSARNSKMIKNLLNAMSITSVQSNYFSYFKHAFSRAVCLFYYFFKRMFKSRLYFNNLVQEFLSFSASKRASFRIPVFHRISTNNTGIHNTSFVLREVINYSPKMLVYFGEVFNIEVEEDHSYVAEGFLVKNCQHSALPTSEEAIAVRGRTH